MGPYIRTIGSSKYPKMASGSSGHNFVREYLASEASADVRGTYADLKFNNASGGGEVIRARGIANVAGAAAGATINAAHFTGRVESGATVSGELNAIRATLEVAGTTPTPGGTLAALQLDVNASASTVFGAEHAYVKVTDSGSTALNTFLNFTAAAASNDPTKLVSTHADVAAGALVHCRLAGADLWLLAALAH